HFSSALLAKELGHSLGQNCQQIRVPQGKEPDHFLSHFYPSFLVRNSIHTMLIEEKEKKPDFAKKQKPKEDEGEPIRWELYQIRGKGEATVKSMQVESSWRSLCSQDVVLLVHVNRFEKTIVFNMKINVTRSEEHTSELQS